MSEERTIWYFSVTWYEDQPNGKNPDAPPITRMIGQQHSYDTLEEARGARAVMTQTRSWFPAAGYSLEITDIECKTLRPTGAPGSSRAS